MQAIESMGICNAKLIGSGKGESGDNVGKASPRGGGGDNSATVERGARGGCVHKPA